MFVSPGNRRVDGNKKGLLTRQREPKAAARLLRERYLAIGIAKNCAITPGFMASQAAAKVIEPFLFISPCYMHKTTHILLSVLTVRLHQIL